MNELNDFRKMKDEFYKKGAESPLDEEQKRDFKGLNYFPENPSLRFNLDIKEFPEKETIQMNTSTGSTQTYNRYGKVKFEVEGQTVELTIYHSDTGFFLPFADGLAGKETYPAGRYLEPEQDGRGK